MTEIKKKYIERGIVVNLDSSKPNPFMDLRYS